MFEYVKPPGGLSPCEATGVIEETQQEFYFRHRGGKASLSIFKKGVAAHCAPSPDELQRFYSRDIKSAGPMLLEQADFLISWWVKQHVTGHRAACAIVEAWFATADTGAVDIDVAEVAQSLRMSKYYKNVLGSFDVGTSKVVFQLSPLSQEMLSECGFSSERVLFADARLYGSNMQITVLGVGWRLMFTVKQGDFDAQRLKNVRAANHAAILRLVLSDHKSRCNHSEEAETRVRKIDDFHN